MKLSRTLKIVLGVLILPPLIIVALFLVALVWPTKPLPIEEVFLGACGSEYNSEYVVGNRPHSYSIAPQGVWYDESGGVTVSKESALNIYDQLVSNSEYELSNGHFEKFVVGEVLANCIVDLESGQVKYKYVLW